MAKDPVCGMMVDEKTAKLKSDYQGKTYYFCNASCKTTFDKNPAKFAKGTSGGHSGGGCCCCGGH
ncbi:MAG: YHS domain-containing protein [Candidatus Bathyarchaeia archaeon]